MCVCGGGGEIDYGYIFLSMEYLKNFGMGVREITVFD